ncbi:vWA domain-containing protein [Polyangium mundeleinium]|uniref:VWA domain-containing protein n=1 Tax=Polyangium mundeleinium TaxID=2995306 RepID=A0ABT5F664_9BACT|nr:VWA domain-containing protein [Polyangium mundeleinium]MDC0748893.1 VWA domain-containing protein [Polyangium mundeleinium]
MFLDFLYELRGRQVPVGTQEAVALGRALAAGLHDSSLEGFYHVARALCVHSEAHLDDFDLAFAKHFRGVHVEAKKIAEELKAWLQDPKQLRQLSEEEKAMIEALDLEEVLRQFEERLREQKERHDGGNRWIGTGGTSPFGRAGFHPSGISMGGGSGGKSAIHTADARKYRSYRSDITLDVRTIEVALRKLRGFEREGALEELDIEGTIDATARNAGELEVVTRPPRRPNTRVLLMMDVGGSMDPYAHAVSQLFSAAKRATHWKELRTYYFHNCVYGKVYKTEGFQDPVSVRDLIHECGKHYKLVMVGDASMAPYELLGAASWGDDAGTPGVAWLAMLREHFERSVWLNPDPPSGWSHGTVQVVKDVFPMYQLTLEGLGEAVAQLVRGGRTRR